MVVREDLEPVVDAAQHQLGGEDVRDGAVVEGDVELPVVLDVVVVRAEKASVAISRQTGDLVHAARYGGRTDRASIASAALHGLQVETRRQRVTAFADERAAAGMPPDAVHGRMRPAV